MVTITKKATSAITTMTTKFLRKNKRQSNDEQKKGINNNNNNNEYPSNKKKSVGNFTIYTLLLLILVGVAHFYHFYTKSSTQQQQQQELKLLTTSSSTSSAETSFQATSLQEMTNMPGAAKIWNEKNIIKSRKVKPPNRYPSRAIVKFRKIQFPNAIKDVHQRNWEAIGTSKCDIDHTNSTNPNLIHALLVGAQKGGTTALYDYLIGHPQIATGPNLFKSKEFFFFDNQMDDHLIKQKSNNNNNHAISQQINRQHLQGQIDKRIGQLQQNQVVLDFTPKYLFVSDRVPQRIACLTPNAKILVVLRNPVDRAYSNYNMKMQIATTGRRHGKTMTFDQYVNMDIDALYDTGVLQDWNKVGFKQYHGSQAEYEAYAAYVRSGLCSPIGFGLYAIQLRHYIQTFTEYGKDPTKDILVFHSSEMKQDPIGSTRKVLQFLNLSISSYENIQKKTEKVVNKRAYKLPPMSNETRTRLTKLFEPYNQELEILLGSQFKGFGQ